MDSARPLQRGFAQKVKIPKENVPPSGFDQSDETHEEDHGELEANLEIERLVNHLRDNDGDDDIDAPAEIEKHTKVREFINVGELVESVVESAGIEAALEN